MRRLSLAACLAACLCPLAFAEGDGPKILADEIYGRKDGMALTLDVIRPAKANGAGVIWVQSGGWYSGWLDPKLMAAASKGFLDKGYTVIVLRHGSAPKYTIPEATADVRRAVRFVRLKAKDYGIDGHRLGVLGGSAGGHLSLMLATTGDDGDPEAKDPVLKQPSRVAAVVALYPPTDISDWVTNPPEIIKKHAGLKPPLTFDAKLAPLHSPALRADAKAAPSLMIHGDKDELVPIEHSHKMIKALEKVKVKCKLVTVEGAAHGFDAKQNATLVAPSMMEWFDTHLAKE